MLPFISLHLAFCATVNVWQSHRIWQHLISKDLVKWLRTIVVLMFKAFAIVSLKRVDHL
jgi:hypothetical protein